ncbi:MAG: hypothetical protein CSB13_04905 [Chloroflexi bacterium]|nr:MAG: hypothetical protein CSB13_04905 [Chloroflexota bacterium]
MHSSELDNATQQSKRGIIIILLAFIILAATASIINPLHEATDELRHYRFVRKIAQDGALPVQGEEGCSAQGHHPPLFYATAAFATFWIDTGQEVCSGLENNPFWAYRYWEVGHDNKNQYLHTSAEQFPWSGAALAAHLARFVNVAFGAATILLTWLIARAVWPKRPLLALGGTAFIAFNPMFVYMSGAINNDIIAAFSGAALTLACVRLLTDPNGLSYRWGVILGLLYSMALMSKFNLAAIAVLVAITMTWVAWRKKQWGLWLKMVLIIGGIVLLLTGWWFARNQMLYGEPTGVQRLTELWGVRNPLESFDLAIYELPYVWTSLWGRFGFGQVPLPEPIYTGLRWLALMAVLGYLLPVLRRQPHKLKEAGAPLLILVINVTLFFAVIFNYLLISPAGPMGRFFFPAMPALAILMGNGLRQYVWGAFSGSEHKTDKWLSLMTNAGMATLTLVALFGYLRPAYARPPRFAVETAVPHPLHAQFDSFIQLHGYDIHPDSVKPGEPIDIDLYWEVTAKPPGNYYFFTHLIDETGTIVAQRDTHPGLGHFPSSQWQTGDRFVESIRLYLPETAYTPATAALSIGFYAPGSYRLGITAADGTSLGDALVLDTIDISPQSDDIPNEINQNFNNQLNLAGYEYNKRVFQSGDVLAVDLFWELLHNQPVDYEVQVRLFDESGREIANGNGRFPSPDAVIENWEPGAVIEDRHLLYIDPSYPSGTYIIHVMLIDYDTHEAENIIAEDGHVLNNRILLSSIRVHQK